MKELVYTFNMMEVVRSLIHTADVEDRGIKDGHYELVMITETMTTGLPAISPQQQVASLPGTIIRVMGFKLVYRDAPTIMTVYVRDGQVINETFGVDSRSFGSGETTQADSGRVGEGVTGSFE